MYKNKKVEDKVCKCRLVSFYKLITRSMEFKDKNLEMQEQDQSDQIIKEIKSQKLFIQE